MKKLINLKEVMIILMGVALITVSTTVFATDLVLGDDTTTTVSGNEYDNAQTVPEDTNTVENTVDNTTNTIENSSNTNNTARTYNTNNSSSNLPQTGIEDYNVGILLIIAVGSAIFAYKKVREYRNV